MYGKHCIKSFAKTLPVLPLSTGEAELMAVVKGTAEVLGMQALLEDLGQRARVVVRSDATAAIGIVARVGLGKVRHLAVADLWIQQAARAGRVSYPKVPGQLNPADMFTKAVDKEAMERHSRYIGQRSIEGRSQAAPQRRNLAQLDESPQKKNK